MEDEDNGLRLPMERKCDEKVLFQNKISSSEILSLICEADSIIVIFFPLGVSGSEVALIRFENFKESLTYQRTAAYRVNIMHANLHR